ncbi:MAG: aldo/keto reductase [Pyrinomonadaceae bacterium]|nr:aldo/keto reductase [Pyrinomonadaceae bacterium]
MSMMGCATPEGTARYGERFRDSAASDHFRHAQNLWLSSIGIGTYLGNWDETTDRRYIDAVARTIELGANVVDTAINYRFQRSERSIGQALRRLISEEAKFARDELVICTKGGYLPFDGAPPTDARRYVEDTFVHKGVANFSDIVAGSHCMTPAYLQNQLNESLANLGLSCIDVYYIHNPETQLQEVSHEEFDDRLQIAFERLEQNVAEGKIKHYGVATWNGFRVPTNAPGYHSLERMVGLAREVGGRDHNFRFIQLPFNLAMPEALVTYNQTLQGTRVTVLEAAHTLGLTVVASASLLQGKVAFGIPEAIRGPLGSLSTEAQTAIQFVRSTPGINTALIGMSRRAHVEENLQLTRVPPVSLEDYGRLFEQGAK